MGDESSVFHTVTSIDFGVTTESSLTVMCNGVRFYITMSLENLQNVSNARRQKDKSSLETQYLQLLDGLQDPKDASGSNVELFEDWALEPCMPSFKQLALARHLSHPLTLEEYFNPITFVLKLVNVNGHLMAVRCPHDPALTAHLTPEISPTSLSVYEKVPCLKASSISIAPGSHPLHDVASDPPTKVHLQDGTQLFFKAALESDSFLRELEILFHIDNMGLTRKLRVPKLQYIVDSSDGSSIIGMLLNYIEHNSTTLRTALLGSSALSRQKWMAQIRDIVNQLHGVGVVWGDVKPDNVLIDKEGDAWVVDFGGGYSLDWVDPEKCGTFSGDLQGISRLEEFLSHNTSR